MQGFAGAEKRLDCRADASDVQHRASRETLDSHQHPLLSKIIKHRKISGCFFNWHILHIQNGNLSDDIVCF